MKSGLIEVVIYFGVFEISMIISVESSCFKEFPIMNYSKITLKDQSMARFCDNDSETYSNKSFSEFLISYPSAAEFLIEKPLPLFNFTEILFRFERSSCFMNISEISVDCSTPLGTQ